MVIFAFLQRKYLNICIIWNLTCMGLYVKALNPPIFGKISKDLNGILCLCILIYLSLKWIKCLIHAYACCVGAVLLSSVIKINTRRIWALTDATKWREDARGSGEHNGLVQVTVYTNFYYIEDKGRLFRLGSFYKLTIDLGKCYRLVQ